MSYLDKKETNVVYRHIRLDTEKVFYIGIGKSGKRAYSKRNRNRHWHHIVNKCGYRVEIIASFKYYEDAKKAEIAYIKKIGKHNLTNMTDGGDGVVGLECSQATREKISKANKGSKHTEEVKNKISECAKEMWKSDGMREHLIQKSKEMWESKEYRDRMVALQRERVKSQEYISKLSQSLKGHEVTPETRAKIGKAHKGKKCPTISKVVIQFDIEGNYLNTFDSTRDAARKTGVAKTGIGNVCTGFRKTAGGFKWKYKDDTINN